MGGAYYTLQGMVSKSPDSIVMIQGAGIISGSQVYLSMSLTEDHTPLEPWRDSSVLQVALNVSTLSGTWWDVGSSFDVRTRTFGPMYGAGTFTFTPCP